MQVTRIIAVLVIGVLLVLSACANPVKEPAALIMMTDGDAHLSQEFIPRTITVPAGSTVTWSNKNNVTHTVVSNEGLFNEKLWPGDSFSYNFTSRGTYTYHCDLFDMVGMVYVK